DENRHNPYLLDEAIHYRAVFTVELPPSCRDEVMLPPTFDWQDPVNNGRVSYQLERRENGRVQITVSADLPPGFYPADKFRDLVYIHERLARPDCRLLLLQQTAEKANELSPAAK
ncbi:MAG: hypothetical protein PHQ27_07570, partial [Victivallales bacterium]|nr:hypothetical protein [Victivallales bacterium]